MLRAVALGGEGEGAAACTLDLRSHGVLAAAGGPMSAAASGAAPGTAPPHGSCYVLQPTGTDFPVLPNAHLTWNWVCEGERLRVAVAAPHATLEGPTALDVLFPAAIAPSPVAGEDSAGDLVLHVALVTGSLYRISLALPLTLDVHANADRAACVMDIGASVSLLAGDGDTLVCASEDGTLRRLQVTTADDGSGALAYERDVVWQAGMVARFLGFVPGLSQASAAGAGVTDLHAIDINGTTVTAVLTAAGRLRILATSTEGRSTLLFDRAALELVAAAAPSAAARAEAAAATAPLAAAGAHVLCTALRRTNTARGPSAVLALFCHGLVAVFHLPLHDAARAAERGAAGGAPPAAPAEMACDPELVILKAGLPDRIRSLALGTAQVAALYDEGGVASVAVAALAAEETAAGMDARAWHPVLPRVDLTARPTVPDNLDPRHVVSSYLFAPGRFRVQSLRRALSDTSSSLHAAHVAAGPPLEREITLAVEQLICAATLELAPEEYRHRELECWLEFLDAAARHEAQTATPVALVAAGDASFLLATPAGAEVLVPCGTLERLYARHDARPCDVPLVAGVSSSAVSSTASDVLRLLAASRSVGDLLGDVLEPDWHLRPLDTAHDVATSVLDGSLLVPGGGDASADDTHAERGSDEPEEEDDDVVDVAQSVWGMLAAIGDLPAAAAAIVTLLDAPEVEPETDDVLPGPGMGDYDEEAVDPKDLAPCCGAAGLAAVTERVHQLASQRAVATRDILVTLAVALRLRQQAALTLNQAARIEALLPALAFHCGTYQRLAWLGELAAGDGSSALMAVAAALDLVSGRGDVNSVKRRSWVLTASHVPVEVATLLHASAARLLALLREGTTGAPTESDTVHEGILEGALLLTGQEVLLLHINAQIHSLDSFSALPRVSDSGIARIVSASHAAAPTWGHTALSLAAHATAPTLLRDYYVGCAFLASGRVPEARDRLEQVIGAVTRLSLLTEAAAATADVGGDGTSAVEPGPEQVSLARQYAVFCAIAQLPPRAGLGHIYHHFVQLFESSLPDALFVTPEADKPMHFRRYAAIYAILELTQAALAELGVDTDLDDSIREALTSALCTIRFKYALNLGLVDTAFTAMLALPQLDVRRDCLQRLVTVLCERGDAQTVVELQYGELQADVRESIEARARSGDALEAVLGHYTNFYELLYAFDVFRGDFRSAGQTMYLLALRLSTEYLGPEDDRTIVALESERDAYLAAINSLRLLKEEDAWLVAPPVESAAKSRARRRRAADLDDSDLSDNGTAAAAAEQSRGGVNDDSMDHAEDSTQQPQYEEEQELADAHFARAQRMVTAREIEQRYVLVQARLDMLEARLKGFRIAGPSMTAEEAVAVMVEGGRFDDAVSLAFASLPRTRALVQLEPVLERLTEECLRLELEDHPAVAWLQLNDVGPRERLSPANCGWLLLRSLLTKYDSAATNFRLRRTVVDRILSLLPFGDGQRLRLPHWLRTHVATPTAAAPEAASPVHTSGTLPLYPGRQDAPTLLRLYVKHARWPEALALAVRLTKDACDALDISVRTERHPTTAVETWLPYNIIDALLESTHDSRVLDSDATLRPARIQLSEQLDRMRQLLKRT